MVHRLSHTWDSLAGRPRHGVTPGSIGIRSEMLRCWLTRMSCDSGGRHLRDVGRSRLFLANHLDLLPEEETNLVSLER